MELAALAEFGSLHPLVVHFPIVYLLTAPIFQAAGLFWQRSAWLGLSTVLEFCGFLSAGLASFAFHAEILGPDEAQRYIFERHEFFATGTLIVASLACFAKLMIWTRPDSARRLEPIALGLMLLAALLVSLTGHLGAEMTHIHRVIAE